MCFGLKNPSLTLRVQGLFLLYRDSRSRCSPFVQQFHKNSNPLSSFFFTDIEFQVKDNDGFGTDLIGVATVPAVGILSGEAINEWFPIIRPDDKVPKPDCAVRLEMRFTPCGF